MSASFRSAHMLLLRHSTMNKHSLIARSVYNLVLLIFSIHAAAFTQDAGNLQADIPGLIRKLKDGNEDVALKAAAELYEIGRPAVSPLIELLNQEKGCRPRVLAAQVLAQLAPDSEAIVSSMLDVVRNPCYWSPQKDLSIRRNAAFVLANTAAGVQALAAMLSSKKTFERRSAAFAFDELTERIEGVRPDSIKSTPELISATKGAIPSLVRALADKDEIVRCMSYESLEQLQRSRHRELRDEANRLMQGAQVRCSR
jgi:HEAT repeat protein